MANPVEDCLVLSAHQGAQKSGKEGSLSDTSTVKAPILENLSSLGGTSEWLEIVFKDKNQLRRV